LNRARRWLPISGALAGLVMASTAVIAPFPPVAGAPTADILAYFTARHVALELGSVCLSVGAVLLMVFAATLYARLGSIASLTAFMAVVALSACLLVEVAAFQTLVYRPSPDAVTATLLNDFQNFGFIVTTFPSLLYLAASSYAILSTNELPRFLGYAAAVAALLQVVGWVSFFAPTGPLAAGGVPSLIAFTAWLGWAMACSVTMVARPAT
jgi:hypothetical protein